MGSQMPPAYFRAYRARRRLEGRPLHRRAGYVRPPRDYSAEYARSLELHPIGRVDDSGLPLLMPDLQHGRAVAFWDDELRLDLAQERELALLEGRDPIAAVAAYRARETSWRGHTAPLEAWAA